MKKLLLLLLLPVTIFGQMSADEYFNRGIEKFDSKDFYGAIEDLNKCIVLHSDPEIISSIYSLRGSVKGSLGEHNGAISDCTKAIELNPNNDSAYLLRGSVKVYLKDTNGAISDYTKVIELRPDGIQAYYQRGQIKFNKKDNYDAISDFTKVIELEIDDPMRGMAFFFRGALKNRLGDIKGACEDFRKSESFGLEESYSDLVTTIIREKCN